MADKPPKITRLGPGVGKFMPTAGAVLLHVRSPAAGGGGAGNNDGTDSATTQIGKRGGDSAFGTWAPIAVSITGGGGSPCVVNAVGHGYAADQPFRLTDIDPSKVYWIVGSANGPDSFQFSEVPSSPNLYQPQPPVTNAALVGAHTLVAYRWVVQGGGPGGRIGDQGPALSYSGYDGAGPDGYVNSWAVQGGAGSGCYGERGNGPGGGVNPMGGNSGAAYSDFGINGTNGTGAGGGAAGSTPATGPIYGAAATSGASGSYGELWLKPDHVNGHDYMIGAGGDGGLAGHEVGLSGGYRGGRGGDAMHIITEWFSEDIEGDWTPVLIGHSVAGSHTYAAQIGEYARKGDWVTAWFRIELSALDPAANGIARITGLPFAPATVSSLGYAGSLSLASFISRTAGYSQFAVQATSGNFIALQELGDNLAPGAIEITDFHNNSKICGSVTYKIG